MSQNRPGNDTGDFGGTGSGAGGTGSGGVSGGTGSGGASGGTGSGAGASGGGLSTTTGGGTGAATATAPSAGGLGARAKEYGQSVAGAASTAKEFLTDKASVVGDKLSGLRDVDYAEYADQAKNYARQNPGQALLVAAAAGFVIGLLVRGGRR
jgi:ElaB/YqjD/DUF883 family membrane-anchored ribosome-binding protein